jgi:hypothetical protein
MIRKPDPGQGTVPDRQQGAACCPTSRPENLARHPARRRQHATSPAAEDHRQAGLAPRLMSGLTDDLVGDLVAGAFYRVIQCPLSGFDRTI